MTQDPRNDQGGNERTGYGQGGHGPPPHPPQGHPQRDHPGQQGYPPPYGYPGQVPYPVPGRTNGLAVAALVLGILWLYWIGSILALIFGYRARRQIRERGESGDGMALAGIVLGWIGIGVLVVVGIVAAIAALGNR